MIDFEQELKKFHPSLEIDEAGDLLENKDYDDIADLLVRFVKESKETAQGEAEE